MLFSKRVIYFSAEIVSGAVLSRLKVVENFDPFDLKERLKNFIIEDEEP